MTSENKSRVINYFQPGDTPLAQEFEALIDLATHASEIDQGTLANEHLPAQIDLTAVSEESSIKAKTLAGDGSAVTNLTPSSITGTLANSQLPDDISVSSVAATILSGEGSGITNLSNTNLPAQIDLTAVSEESSIKAKTLAGDGSAVTNLTPSSINGTLANSQLPDEISVTSVAATTLSGEGSGITNLSNTHLPAQIDLTAVSEESSIKAKTLAGDGSAVTNLTPSSITGTLANSQLPDDISVTSVAATTLSGDGSAVTNLTPSSINGTLANSQLPDDISVSSVAATILSGEGSGITNLSNTHLPAQIDLTVVSEESSIKAKTLAGDGSAVTNLTPSSINGTLANSQLPDDISVSSVAATTLSGDGSAVTNLEASNITTGNIAVDRLPDASTEAKGITRYATAEDIDAKRTDRVVTAEQLSNHTLDASKITGSISNTLLPSEIQVSRMTVDQSVSTSIQVGSDGTPIQRILAGRVSLDGSKLSGSGFNAQKNATGQYTITFVPAFAEVPVFTATLEKNGTGSTDNTLYVEVKQTEAVVTISDFTDSGMVGQDTPFSFICMGV